MVRPTVAVDHALVVLCISLARHNHPTTANKLPNIAITVSPPHTIIMIHPLEEFKVHLEIAVSNSACL
jgi:hypothetical protein